MRTDARMMGNDQGYLFSRASNRYILTYILSNDITMLEKVRKIYINAYLALAR